MTRIIFLLTLVLGSTVHAAAPGLQIKNAWIQEGPPNARVLAGFMQITNPSNKTISITGASSDAFKRIEFHRSSIKSGMASMQHQPHLNIAHGKMLELKSGGYHLMMMQATRKLRAGDKVQVLFKTHAGIEIPLTMIVRRP